MTERPWTWEEDGCTVIRGNARTAPGCHDNCGILMYVKNGRLVKVEGDPENPYNGGRLCSRCLTVKDLIYHQDRLKYPMKRTGQRGENKWERISWDQAYDLIEEKFNKIKAEYGAEAVLFGQGTGRDVFQISRLAYAFGSPNWGNPYFSGIPCYLPRVASLGVIAGDVMVADCAQFFPERYDHPEYKPPQTLIIWGNNPLVANSDGFYGHWVIDLMKRGTKLIVIDPQLTWLASRADLWLRVKPGTDGALVMGMLSVIIEEGLIDEEFIDKYVYGFEELKERVKRWSPKKASEITWIPEEKIIEAARLYAGSKAAAIQWGVAIDQTIGGVEAAFGIVCLWAITGNIDVPGGNVIGRPCWGLVEPNWTGGWGVNELLTEEQRAKRLGINEYPLYNYGFQVGSADVSIQAMETGKPYPVKAMWIQSANPLSCMGAEPRRIYNMLNKLDFIVVADLFMTPSAMALADVILPVATFAEKIGYSGMNPYYTGAIVKAIDSEGEVKSDACIDFEMGKRFNPAAYPWETEEEMYDSILAQAGVSYKELKEKGWMYPEFAYRKHEKGLLRPDGEPGFNTSTGKIELYSHIFESIGLDPLPDYVPPALSPTDEYPLVLTSGARNQEFFHSEHRQIARLRKTHPDPLVYINPQLAAEKGIAEGDWVVLENHLGQCRLKAKFNKTLDPRVVNADHGWWFPEKSLEESEYFGAYESNINVLIPIGCGKSGFGGSQKSSVCKIYKAV